ncbi:MAG: hypothetical protein WC955_10010 [Elusimicrobiota bacterium]
MQILKDKITITELKQMNIQHRTLAAGRWNQLSFIEQMANIGSETNRALNWQTKQNASYSQQAFIRALELLDLTLGDKKNVKRLKEIARLRETLVDYFLGSNEYNSSSYSMKKYFDHFAFAARNRF